VRTGPLGRRPLSGARLRTAGRAERSKAIGRRGRARQRASPVRAGFPCAGLQAGRPACTAVDAAGRVEALDAVAVAGVRRLAAVVIGGLRWTPPARRGARPRSAGEPAGPAPRSTPPPRRGARCRPRAAPVVRYVKFTPDCRRDLRRIVANVEAAAVLTCGRCSPVSGRARRRPVSLQWAITGLHGPSRCSEKCAGCNCGWQRVTVL
jgi:hypothetical protein